MIEKVDLDGRVVPTINGFKEYENGGKGSGFFGHMGRPGKLGGSSKGSGKIDKEATKRLREELERLGDSFRESPGMKVLIEKDKTGEVKDGASKSEYKVGDSYTKGGVTYDVVDGKNGPHAVSKDGKISTELPDKLRHDQTEMIKDTFDGMRDEGIPMGSPRYEAARDIYKRVQERAIETSRKGLDASKAPKMVREEVDRFLRQIETTGPSKSVESYYKTASGILDGWAKGNGGIAKPQSSAIRSEIKELRGELKALYERYRIMTTPKGFRE